MESRSSPSAAQEAARARGVVVVERLDQRLERAGVLDLRQPDRGVVTGTRDPEGLDQGVDAGWRHPDQQLDCAVRDEIVVVADRRGE